MSHAAVKEWLADWCERTIRADFAEKIAQEIEMSVSPCPRLPLCDAAWCPACDRAVHAQALAAMVRRKGGVL